MRSCALAARPAWLKVSVASSAFAVVASGERLALKSVIGEVTLAKLPESGGSAAMMFLKTVVPCAASAKRLPAAGASSKVPPCRLIVPALKVGYVPGAALCVTLKTSVPPVWL